jgi:putative transposase
MPFSICSNMSSVNVFGYLYLVAYIDWYSRYVISWELSNSLEASFCIEALSKAQQELIPSIINTDQGSQFTCKRFVKAVLDKGSSLSMDVKGRAIDNVFTERFWRTLKYEEVYLREYRTGHEAWWLSPLITGHSIMSVTKIENKCCTFA